MMTVSHASGALKKLQRTQWQFQRTFKTPLGDLERFVDAIASAHPEMSGGLLGVESVVFEPKHAPQCATPDIWRTLAADSTIAVDSPADARSLLIAALSDWLDFYFVPEPKPFALYADHDEYCTFYAANSRSKLSRVCDTLVRAGFQPIDGYERPA
jgi:hypothetical protein